ncbi:hypothetical protein D3C84_1197770 [compost metagenome]
MVGQLSNFDSDDLKALSMLASVCRFNRSIQRKQMRAGRNLFDHMNNLADLLGVLIQLFDQFGRGLALCRQTLHSRR